MLIKFATKRNTNGHRYYIAIDTDRKTYSQNPASILYKGDFVEITKAALHDIKQQAVKDGYTPIEAL